MAVLGVGLVLTSAGAVNPPPPPPVTVATSVSEFASTNTLAEAPPALSSKVAVIGSSVCDMSPAAMADANAAGSPSSRIVTLSSSPPSLQADDAAMRQVSLLLT